MEIAEFATMKVTMLLCDHVAVESGKLYVAGGGWNIMGPTPTPFGIGLLVDVPWDQANREHELRMWLEREDGQRVIVGGEEVGLQPVQIEATFEVGRPAGVPSGSPLTVPMAFNLPTQPVEPGARYRWVLQIDGEGHPDWTLAFTVRSA